MDGAGVQPLQRTEAGSAFHGQRQTNESCRTGMQLPCLPSHYREVTYLRYSAPSLRDGAVIWIMNTSRPNSSRAGAGVVLMKLVCLTQLRPGSGPSHGIPSSGPVRVASGPLGYTGLQ